MPGQPYLPSKTDGQAVASLVLGIASVLFCFTIFTGIPAIVLGHLSWSRIRRSMGRLKGEGLALAGLVMGYISIPWLLVVLSIALPNIVRSKMAANESAAASTVRTINTTQVTYSTTYPDHGYAPDLATLGPGPAGNCVGEGTADHACLLDNLIGNARCTAGAWCTKYGFRFTLTREGSCGQPPGSQQDESPDCTYVVVATPINSATGRKNFCSTADAVIRYKFGLPMSQPISAAECSTWDPIT
jgi:type II secretory pathway pseudopilin PulG